VLAWTLRATEQCSDRYSETNIFKALIKTYTKLMPRPRLCSRLVERHGGEYVSFKKLLDKEVKTEIMKPLLLSYLLCFTLLSNAQRYKNIHQEAIVVDSHNDVLRAAVMRGMDLANDLKKRTHSDFQRFKQGQIDVQVFSVFCNSTFGKDTAFKLANIEIDSLYSIASRHPNKLLIVKTPEEIVPALNRGSIAGIIGVEGGHMIEDKLEYLDSLFNRGARYLTLTWNNSTSWASSSQDETDSSSKLFKGLNDFGKTVVRRMNELGMMMGYKSCG
jgi:membrane dipeptidase